MATMRLTVVDEPSDRPEWIRETLRLLAERTERGRTRLLERVALASDAELVAGSDDDWGVGQVATHLLIVERGMALIALRLASGQPPGPTGQPRPAAAGVSREGVATAAEKAAATLRRLGEEFPAEPDTVAVARSPYYGGMNCFGWLLMLPYHYEAHLEALDRGRKSAL